MKIILSQSLIIHLFFKNKCKFSNFFAKKRKSHGLFSDSDIFIWIRKELDPLTQIYTAGHEVIHFHQIEETTKLEAKALSDGAIAQAYFLNFYGNFLGVSAASLEGLSVGYFSTYTLYPEHQFMPFNQFGGVPLWMGQLGSGTGSQPFETVEDYNNWIKRATAFAAWSDSAIVYFRKGIKAEIVLPESLVVKMIPQMESMIVNDPTTSIFYGPVNKMPESFSEADRKKYTNELTLLINQQ
jgi:hypothetical protein